MSLDGLGDDLCGRHVSIPDKVRNACLERGKTEDWINNASVKEIFIEFCEWEGICNWGSSLWDVVDDLTNPLEDPLEGFVITEEGASLVADMIEHIAETGEVQTVDQLVDKLRTSYVEDKSDEDTPQGSTH